MEEVVGNPHIAMIVPNAVTGDSRVQKAAISAARAGYRVTLVGRSDRVHWGAELLEDALIVRLSPEYPLAQRHGVRAAQARNRRKAASDVLRARQRALRRRIEMLGADSTASTRAKVLLLTVRHRVLGLRARIRTRSRWRLHPRLALSNWRDRLAIAISPTRGWRVAWPVMEDFSDAFTPTLVELAPDLIHVNDAPLLPAAHAAARLLAAKGHSTKVMYDAHEWWPGVDVPNKIQWRATCGAEARFVKEMDAVMTVGTDLAEWLRDRHGLTDRPWVVANCPSASRVPAKGRRTVREEVGLPADVALLVYSGSLSAQRGVATAVEALAELPDVHLAIIADPAIAHLAEIMRLAEELGVEARVHTRRYVPPESITWYLSSATIGLAPFHRNASHDSALATKVSEYIHAGLPLVVSDCVAQARFVRETGVGEVFTAEDTRGFAQAARAVLAALPAYQAAITPEVLDSRGWEAQEEILLRAYGELVGRPTTVHGGAGAATAPPAVFVVGDSDYVGLWSDALRKALPGAAVSSAEKIRRHRPGQPGPDAAGSAVDLFVAVSNAGQLVIDGLHPTFGPLCNFDVIRELALLSARGVRVAVVVGDGDAETLHRHRRELDSLGIRVLARDPELAVDDPGVTWLPTVAAASAGHVSPLDWSAPLGVWVPRDERSLTEVDAAEVLDLLEVGGHITRVADVGDGDGALADRLANAHIVVANLGAGGDFEGLVASAMAAGRVVVRHLSPAARARCSDEAPTVEATSVTLGDVLRALDADRQHSAELAEASRRWASTHHDGRMTAQVLGDAIEAC